MKEREGTTEKSIMPLLFIGNYENVHGVVFVFKFVCLVIIAGEGMILMGPG